MYYVPISITKSLHRIWVVYFSRISVLTQFPMSLHFYNDDTTYFTPSWTLTHSPTIIDYIVTTRKFPCVSASAIKFFLYFLNTNNVYRNTTTPVITETFNKLSFIRPYPNYCYASHTSISNPIHLPITYVRANFLQKQSPSK